ncbi:MAG: MarR family transcriptional regulator [Pseudomonadota bacterium]|nr:MarR family transcriptional regulator [Pseudomonadota bacterium]
MGSPARLSPTMRSRKLQALDFIKRFFAQWGHSPTLSEIAAALGVSKQRASGLVERLSRERQIEVVASKPRGIRLPDRSGEFSEADVLLRLQQMGVHIVGGLTEKGLPPLPELGHDPDRIEPDRKPLPGGSGDGRSGAGSIDGAEAG